MAPREGGDVDTEGIEQYARHGRGSLSGLRTWIRRRVSKIPKIVKMSRVKIWQRD